MAACGAGVRRAACGVRRVTAVSGGGVQRRVRLTEETGLRQ